MVHVNRLFTFVAFLAFLAFGLSACTTYFIPVDSFRQQFAGMDSSHLRTVTTRGPLGNRVTYQAYDIDFIKCVDDKGNDFELPNSPSIEIRFTDSNNRRTIFYFDLMRVNDSTVNGGLSRTLFGLRKTISLDKIRKIEVQDGRKNFHYVNQPAP